jgi:hypothetical protein
VLFVPHLSWWFEGLERLNDVKPPRRQDAKKKKSKGVVFLACWRFVLLESLDSAKAVSLTKRYPSVFSSWRLGVLAV